MSTVQMSPAPCHKPLLRPTLKASLSAAAMLLLVVPLLTSEADARKGEKSEEFSGPSEQYMQLFGDMAFLDLRDPILRSP